MPLSQGLLLFFHLFSRWFLLGKLQGSSILSYAWSMPAPGIVCSFLLSISHCPAVMDAGFALKLIAQPQSEGLVTRLGYFYICFLSGLRHCNITVFQPFCDRVWGGSTYPAHRQLYTCQHQFLAWGGGCLGMPLAVCDAQPRLLREPLFSEHPEPNHFFSALQHVTTDVRKRISSHYGCHKLS